MPKLYCRFRKRFECCFRKKEDLCSWKERWKCANWLEGFTILSPSILLLTSRISEQLVIWMPYYKPFTVIMLFVKLCSIGKEPQTRYETLFSSQYELTNWIFRMRFAINYKSYLRDCNFWIEPYSILDLLLLQWELPAEFNKMRKSMFWLLILRSRFLIFFLLLRYRFFKFLMQHVEDVFKRSEEFDTGLPISSKNFISYQYEGLCSNVMKCSKCKNSVEKESNFLELLVSLNDDEKYDVLQNSIKEYIGVELLRDDNR